MSRAAFLVCFFLLAACSPSTEASGSSAKEGAPKNPFFGRWQLIHAQVAPWWNGEGEMPIADPAFTMAAFEPDKSSGASIVTCDKPQYAVSLIGPPGLFEGNLADPFVQARMLGFLDKDITAMSFSCESDAADVSLEFAMLDENTIMLGLDNMIYTLTRTPG